MLCFMMVVLGNQRVIKLSAQLSNATLIDKQYDCSIRIFN